VRFFFDNHQSPEIVEILQKAEIDAVHLRDIFDDQGIDDREWIPIVAERGWILVTGDHRITRRREERRIFRESKLTTFFLAKEYNNKTARVRIRWIFNQWEKIEAAAQKATPGDCFLVPMKGKLKRIEWEHEG
jgi:hypothetical protein